MTNNRQTRSVHWVNLFLQPSDRGGQSGWEKCAVRALGFYPVGTQGPGPRLFFVGERDILLLKESESVTFTAFRIDAMRQFLNDTRAFSGWSEVAAELDLEPPEGHQIYRTAVPRIAKLWLWREVEGSELQDKRLEAADLVLTNKTGGRTLKQEESVFEGDARVSFRAVNSIDSPIMELAHLAKQSEHAHYQFEIELAIAGETYHWDPDIHDQPPSTRTK